MPYSEYRLQEVQRLDDLSREQADHEARLNAQLSSANHEIDEVGFFTRGRLPHSPVLHTSPSLFVCARDLCTTCAPLFLFPVAVLCPRVCCRPWLPF